MDGAPPPGTRDRDHLTGHALAGLRVMPCWPRPSSGPAAGPSLGRIRRVPRGGWGRRCTVKMPSIFGLRVSMFRQYLLGPWAPASSVRFVLADQDGRETYGGPMTVVAGIIALLLLGYLVVALLNPERF